MENYSGSGRDDAFLFGNRRSEHSNASCQPKYAGEGAWFLKNDPLGNNDCDTKWEDFLFMSVDTLDSDDDLEEDREAEFLCVKEDTQGDFIVDKKGEPVILTTNYFKVHCDAEKDLYKYKVKFEGNRLNNVSEILRSHSAIIGPYIEDRYTLYCAKKPPLELPLTDAENYIYLEFVDEVKPHEARHLRMYETLVKTSLQKLNFRMIGKCYYDINSPRRIENYGLEVCPGYMFDVTQFKDDVLLGVDVTHKIISRTSLLDLLERLMEDYGYDYKEKFKAEVIGLAVWTHYDNKLYRVEAVDFSHTPLSKLPQPNQQGDMTYKDFYKMKWGVDVQSTGQPMLIADDTPRSGQGPTQKCFLIPEFCAIAGLVSSLKNDACVKSWIADQRLVTPGRRIARLEDFNQRLLGHPTLQRQFELWNMLLDSEPFEVTGRILPMEKLIFGGDCRVEVKDNGTWESAYNEKSFYEAKELQNWVVITPRAYQVETKKFMAKVRRSARNFRLSEPKYVVLPEVTTESYASTLDAVITELDPKIIAVITPGRHPDIYPVILNKCYLENSVSCQVITDRCFTSEEQDDFAIKVAIQLNCKMGGVPWSIHMPLNGVMFVGIDVCQDKVHRNNNYISLVATIDRDFTRYVTMTSAYETDPQKTSCLTSNLFKILDKYREANDNRLPARIIIYRGSVLERDVRLITEHEVNRVHSALCRVYGDERRVKLSFITVSTNPHARLFHKKGNPPVGTVVDSVITQPSRLDFFLVSQALQEDSVTPTYYNVVHNSGGLTLERIEIVTFKLTHMYFTNSHSIRVPAPLQYAHKLGAMMANSLHTTPYTGLRHLYFL